jgi:gliding motility-associated-like protein
MTNSRLLVPYCANYFRNIAYKRITVMKTIRLFAIVVAALCLAGNALAQGCTDALTNSLCADTPSPVDTLTNTPFSNACFSATQTSFYSFQTNSVADVGSVQVAVTYVDCDYTTSGLNDTIFAMVIPLPPGADPCNPPANVNTICYSDTTSFTFDVYNLYNGQDYLVVVGSNHQTIYGPCAFAVDISGSAVDLVAGVDPILVSLGESAHLVVDGPDPSTSVNWTPSQFLDDPTSLNPEVTAEETTSFQVTGTVGDCTLTDDVTLTVGPPIEIYNTFTPNGDGINDSWRIKYIERFPNCQIEVFDRWGQSIFKSVGYAQNWDGTYKGKPLPTSAYAYVIELNSLEVTIPPLLGTVSIVH